MGAVIEHLRAPVQTHALAGVKRILGALEPNLGFGLAQVFAQRALHGQRVVQGFL